MGRKKNSDSEQSVATVETVVESNSEIVEKTYSEEVLGVHKFVTDPARIGTKVGLTLNLGNFDSVRIDVWCELPCYKEEVDQAYTFAQKWCEQRVEAEKRQIMDFRNKKSKNSNPL